VENLKGCMFRRPFRREDLPCTPNPDQSPYSFRASSTPFRDSANMPVGRSVTRVILRPERTLHSAGRSLTCQWTGNLANDRNTMKDRALGSLTPTVAPTSLAPDPAGF
jgi:hypothetical protein